MIEFSTRISSLRIQISFSSSFECYLYPLRQWTLGFSFLIPIQIFNFQFKFQARYEIHETGMVIGYRYVFSYMTCHFL